MSYTPPLGPWPEDYHGPQTQAPQTPLQENHSREERMLQRLAQARPESATIPPAKPTAPPIGGFLYVLGALLLFGAITTTIDLYQMFAYSLDNVVTNSMAVLFAIIEFCVLYLFFIKSEYFPMLLHFTLYIGIIISFLTDPKEIVFFILLVSVLLIWYTKVSKRVAETFIL